MSRAQQRPDSGQAPDTKPGAYYVSMFDREGNNGKGRTALLAGPFVDAHADALAMVDRARDMAYEVDPRSHWYAFGTVRLPAPAQFGALNKLLGLPA